MQMYWTKSFQNFIFQSNSKKHIQKYIPIDQVKYDNPIII